MASKRQSLSVVLLTVSYETVSFWAVRIRSKRAVYTHWKVGVAKIAARFVCHFSALPAPNSCRRLWGVHVLYYGVCTFFSSPLSPPLSLCLSVSFSPSLSLPPSLFLSLSSQLFTVTELKVIAYNLLGSMCLLHSLIQSKSLLSIMCIAEW